MASSRKGSSACFSSRSSLSLREHVGGGERVVGIVVAPPPAACESAGGAMRKIAGLILCLAAFPACGGGSSSPTSPTDNGSAFATGGNSPAGPGPSSPQVVNAEVSGPIDSLTGSSSTFQFKIGSRVVRGGSSTTFDQGGNRATSSSDLKNGVRVEVKGQQGDGFIQATRIHLEDDDEVEPNDDDDDEPPNNPPPSNPAPSNPAPNNPNAEVSVQATLTAILGSKPTLML